MVLKLTLIKHLLFIYYKWMHISKNLNTKIFINDYLNNKDNIKIYYLWKYIPDNFL
jgi:hypothetical protein